MNSPPRPAQRTSADVAIGLLGTAFMGRAHSHALNVVPTLEAAPPVRPILAALCGRDQDRASMLASRFGWGRIVADWHDLVTAPDIDVFDNSAPNHLHAEPTIAALRAGKHVICEKPLGRNPEEAKRMLDVAVSSGLTHMCAFNYRFFPAIRLARAMLDEGKLGDIYHFRSRFLLATGALPDGNETSWRLQRESAGSGVVGDLLAHHIDLARYLVGEPTAVSGAATRTWTPQRHGVTVDVEDAVVSTVEFENGAIGALEATRVTQGHTLESVVGVDGAPGSLLFDVQRPNELRYSTSRGLTIINVTDTQHPFADLWWPRGHGISWGDSFVNELRHFLGACAGAWDVGPHGATFEDGYRCAIVCDAILRAAAQGVRIPISEPQPQNTQDERR